MFFIFTLLERSAHIDRSHLRRLSAELERTIIYELLYAAKEDQIRQRNGLTENLQNISSEKDKEHKRQVLEGFESAHATEQENDRFKEIFLPDEKNEPNIASDSLYDTKEKYPEYGKVEHRLPGPALRPKPEDMADSLYNLQKEDPTYDVIDPAPGLRLPRPGTKPRPLPSRKDKEKKCIIL